MSSELEPVPHALTVLLPPEHRLVGMVSLRFDPATQRVNAVGHKIDGVRLPSITPALLRLLADELEIERFREELDDAPVGP